MKKSKEIIVMFLKKNQINNSNEFEKIQRNNRDVRRVGEKK